MQTTAIRGPVAPIREPRCGIYASHASREEGPVDLFDLVAETGALPEHITVRYLVGLLDAVERAALASGKVPCMSPENIMLSMDGEIIIRTDALASFGAEVGNAMSKAVPYFPPESNSSAEKFAVWSLGVIVFCMLAGYPPFAEAYAPTASTNPCSRPCSGRVRTPCIIHQLQPALTWCACL